MTKTIRAWLLAAVLVPAVLGLVIAAVVIVPRTAVISARPADVTPSPPTPAPPEQPPPQHGPTALTIALVTSPTGGPPLALTVTITTDPPVPQDTLEGTRGYLTGLLESLVKSPPEGWMPDADGLATITRAIEQIIPVSLAPSLPAGTRVRVSADVAAAPEERPTP